MYTGRRYMASGFLVMSIFALSLFCTLSTVLLSLTEVSAATRYVKPSGEAAVRRGQGNDYKIVAMVKDGVAVELLEENDSYSLVKLLNGVEGWILKRFLSVEPPLDDVVAALRKEKELLQQREMEVTQQIEEMSLTLSRTKADLDVLVAERDKVIFDYQSLQRDTADVMKIKNDLERTVDENSQLAARLISLEQENNKLKKDKAINWFLTGAGVLCAGLVIGRLPSPSRKRKTSLLS